jgi:hypothetical protein
MQRKKPDAEQMQLHRAWSIFLLTQIRYDIEPTRPAGHIVCEAHIVHKAYRKSRQGFISRIYNVGTL